MFRSRMYSLVHLMYMVAVDLVAESVKLPAAKSHAIDSIALTAR